MDDPPQYREKGASEISDRQTVDNVNIMFVHRGNIGTLSLSDDEKANFRKIVLLTDISDERQSSKPFPGTNQLEGVFFFLEI